MSELILINDIFDELKQENEIISSELTISEKNCQFLGKFKLILNKFTEKCVCSETNDLRNEFISLENDYKKFFNDLNKISGNLKTKNVNSEKTIEKREKVCEKRKFVNKRKFKTKSETDDEFVVENTDEVIDSSEGETLGLIGIKVNNKKLVKKIKTKGVFCSVEPEKRFKVYRKTGSKTPISYGCVWDKCKYIARTEQRILTHIRTKHTFEKPFNCQFCNYKSSTDAWLDVHIRYKHSKDDLKYKCDINDCEYRASTLPLLNLHKCRPHSSDTSPLNRYECKHTGCGKVFTKPEYLTSHKIIHNTERPYACDWPGCESAFKKNSYLKTHRMTHTGEKPYVCQWPECGKRFRNSAHLYKHECLHTGVRKFGCLWPGCDHRFTSNFNLKLHLKTHQKRAANNQQLTNNNN